jgi:SAM domain (Sterile alpha motif)
MVDVSRWLAEQGLGHHAEAFAQNGIAGDILRELTDADLKELGLNLGDRKRLLKAIAALDAETTQVRAGAVELAATPAAPREAERRRRRDAEPRGPATGACRASVGRGSARRRAG